ncbi:methylated-DNA--[protein]-cysteine S-methyltransferase [Actinokineospora sp. 24-640]
MTVAVVGLETELGELAVAAGPDGLRACQFVPPAKLAERFRAGPRTADNGRVLDQAAEELTAYLAGELREFTVPVDIEVPTFDRTVLTTLNETVGYGRTTSYGQLARDIGLPVTAARAVGRALGSNPALLVIPCHRVLGASGALTGYAGGLQAKRTLLDLETDHGEAEDLRLF